MKSHICMLLSLICLMLIVSCTHTVPETAIEENRLSGEILFKSASPNTGFELFTIDPDGSNITQLTHLNNLITDFQLSPDREYIAFGTFPDSFSTNLVLNVMRSDGSEIIQLIDNTTGGIFWSPDSQKVAFISKRDGLKELYVININGSEEQRLTFGTTDKFMNDVRSASWSPDGKKITFIRSRELYMIDANGQNEKRLLLNENPKYGARWINNGQNIAFAMTINSQTAVYTIKPDSSELTKVIDLPSRFTGFSWSHDNQRIIYTPKENGKVSAFLINVDTKEKFHISEDILGISWSPDGHHITYIQGSDKGEKMMYVINIDGVIIHSFIANNIYNDSSPLWFK